MICVICGFLIQDAKPARHLPHFFQCANCGGYVTEEKEKAEYPMGYFTEEFEGAAKKSLFSPMLDFFLWLRFLKISKLARKKDAVILDYGCGNGRLVSYLRKKGLHVDGYDPSQSAIALAQKRGLPVFSAVPDKKYDLIMFWHSLEHSDTPLHDVLAIANNAQKRGKLLIAVPNGDSLEARFARESFFCYDWPFHRVHFTPKSLSILLENAGFRVLSVDYFNPEYTVSSFVQTFLNLFLPKNALYSMVARRRKEQSAATLALLFFVSVAFLVLFSSLIVLFFLIVLITKKTAAFIVLAQKI